MFGYIVDNWGGPRRANWIGCCCVGLGLLALSQSDSKTLDLYPAGFVLLALGGPGVHISLFHIAMLFPPAYKNTVQSVLVGAFIFSGIAFPVERWLFSLGFERANVLGAHGILLLCQMSVALTLWPPAKFSSGDAVRFRRNSFLSYIVIRKEAEACRMSPRQHDAEPSPQVQLASPCHDLEIHAAAPAAPEQTSPPRAPPPQTAAALESLDTLDLEGDSIDLIDSGKDDLSTRTPLIMATVPHRYRYTRKKTEPEDHEGGTAPAKRALDEHITRQGGAQALERVGRGRRETDRHLEEREGESDGEGNALDQDVERREAKVSVECGAVRVSRVEADEECPPPGALLHAEQKKKNSEHQGGRREEGSMEEKADSHSFLRNMCTHMRKMLAIYLYEWSMPRCKPSAATLDTSDENAHLLRHCHLSGPQHTPHSRAAYEYARLVIYMMLHVLHFNWYIGTLLQQIARIHARDAAHARDDAATSGAQVQSFALGLAVMMPLCGLVAIPFVGRLLDTLPLRRGGFLACNVTGALYAGLACFPLLSLQWLTLFVLSLHRVLLFSSLFAYTGSRFGGRNFGSIIGVTTFIAGLFGLLQYPLALIAEEYGYVPVNIALLVAVLKLSTLAY